MKTSDSNQTLPEFTDDTGTVFHGAEAIQAMRRFGLEKQQRRQRAFARMTPLQRYQLDRWYAAGRPPMPPQRPVATTAPNTRAREHRPAATRRAAASSESSGTDPGDPDPEPAPPAFPDPFADLLDEVRGGGIQLALFGRSVA